MRLIYKIYKVIYWPLIMLPSVCVVLLSLLMGIMSFYWGTIISDHIKNHQHPHFVDIPVDFSKPGVIKTEFDYGPLHYGDVRLILIVKDKKTSKIVSEFDFPVKGRIFFKVKKAGNADFEEYSNTSIESLHSRNWSLIDQYMRVREGLNQLEINVEKGNSDLQNYSQRLILNDKYCLGGMDDVVKRFVWGGKCVAFSIIIIFLNVLLQRFMRREQNRKAHQEKEIVTDNQE